MGNISAQRSAEKSTSNLWPKERGGGAKNPYSRTFLGNNIEYLAPNGSNQIKAKSNSMMQYCN